MPAFVNKKHIVTGLLGLLWLVGCFKANPQPDYTPMRSEVERLYLNYHELKAVYGDLRAAALVHIERSGGQLSEIQSAARLIDQANLVAYYQWELLSITEYIRDGARKDFFTLRVKDIADAHRKSKDLLLTIKVYDAFIKDAAALALIEKAVAHIEQNMAIYEALHALMVPMANQPETTTGGGWQISL
jgi:hypothetical protein